MNRNLFIWIAIPFGLLCIIASIIVALPSLVASSSHRGTIEALASSVAGRQVHIAGSLSLSLFPEPQLNAGNVTIDGLNGETIKSRSLTLDIAMPALLRGQLTASSLILQSPVIAFPWPLPGGPTAVAPPPWLTTLHAQINNGRISFGSLVFSNVNADIFTATGGGLSISGSADLANHPLNLTASLGATDLAGQAPLALQVNSGNNFAHFSGNFSTGNAVSGSLAASLSGAAWIASDPAQKLTLSATLDANPAKLSLTSLTLAQNRATLTGRADLDLAALRLNLNLIGSDIEISNQFDPAKIASLPNGTIDDDITVNRLTAGKITIPHLHEVSHLSNQGLDISSSTATFPAGATASLSGSIDKSQNIQAKLQLTACSMNALLGAATATATPPTATNLTATLSGTADHLLIGPVAGVFGGSAVDGSAVMNLAGPVTIESRFHVKQLNLLDASQLLQSAEYANALAGNFEITADRASLANLAMSRLLIDGGFGQALTIRRISASLYDGLFAGDLTIGPNNSISAAHAFLTIPSAAPLASLAARFNIPAAVLNAPLALSISAAGSSQAIATSATGSLGQFSFTGSPTIDLTKAALAGPITLRHPSAIAAFKLFGLNAGLSWPGAGSISLRSDITLSNNSFGFPNFVASIGDLSASGTLDETDGTIKGMIDADTLALPPMTNDLTGFWKLLPAMNGRIGIKANQVWLSGIPIFGSSDAALTLMPNQANLAIGQASLGGGTLTGTIKISQTAPQPPAVTANFQASNIDLSKLTYPFTFPLALTAGIANFNTAVTANGFTPQTWAATLTGTLGLQAKNGTVSGFSLSNLAAGLNAPNRAAAVKAAAQTGATNFASLTISGNLNNGIFKIGSANLQSNSGTATATGTVDLTDQDTGLNFGLNPLVTPPVTIGLAIIGSWNAPRKIPNLKAALNWQAAN